MQISNQKGKKEKKEKEGIGHNVKNDIHCIIDSFTNLVLLPLLILIFFLSLEIFGHFIWQIRK